MFQETSLIVIIIIHVFLSIGAIIASNTFEKSIIIDRINKYIFFTMSLIYSFIIPQLILGAITYVKRSTIQPNVLIESAEWILLVMFLLIQVLVYRVLNIIEEK